MAEDDPDYWHDTADLRSVETHPNAYDAARAESDLAFIAKKRREIEWWEKNIIEWWQHNVGEAKEKIARAEDRLKAFAIQYRMEVGGSQISLANGFVTVSKQRERIEIYDRNAWEEWKAGEPWPTHFYDIAEPKLNESKVKQSLTLVEDGSFVYGDGEIVPGIRRVKPGPLDFNVKINAGRTYTEGEDDDVTE